MRTYADPTVCPNCGHALTDASRCPGCGIALHGPRGHQLLGLFVAADRLLAEMRTEAEQYAAPAWTPRSGTADPAPTSPGPADPAPTPTPGPATPRRRWSAGSLLLALGALCLVVAGVVFVAVSWEALGLFGRTLVLLTVTGLACGSATLATLRRLVGSAEALWAVTGCLFAADFAAARSVGLLGLDGISAEAATAGFAGVLVALGVGVAVWARGPLGRNLWTAQAGIVLGATALAGSLGWLTPGSSFARILVALVVSAAVAVLAARLRLVWSAAPVGGFAVLAYAVGFADALGRLGGADVRDLWVGGEAVPMLVLVALVVLTGLAVQAWASRRHTEEPGGTADTGSGTTRVTAAALARVAAGTAGLVASGELALLGYATLAGQRSLTEQTLAVAAVALTLMAVAAPVRGPWGGGVRVTGGLAALVLCIPALTWVGVATETLARSTSPVWSAGLDATLRPAAYPPGPAWLASVALGALAVVAAVVALWRDAGPLAGLRGPMLAIAAVLAGSAGAVQLGLHPLPVLEVAGAVLLAGALAAAAGLVRDHAPVQWGALAVLVIASLVPMVSQAASLLVWTSALAVVVVVAAVARGRVSRAGASALAGIWAVSVTVSAVDLSGAGARWTHLALVLVACALGLAAQALREDPARRVPSEVVAGAAGLAAVVIGVLDPALSLAWQSAMLTVLGAATALVSLLRADRRPLAVPASLLLGAAYVLRLAASDIGVVEAYTLPFGALLLAAGAWRMRRHGGTSAVLLPGLSLTLLPSLPLALEDPATLRGLLLGLGALVVLAAGLVLRWRVPFLAGVGVAAVLALRHLGPYADALPRWALIAGAGLALLGVGISWEARVRDARAAALAVRAMR